MDEDIVICMDNPEAMKTLCAINDGDCALLYAYASASGGKCRLNDAQLHTGFDDRRMERRKAFLSSIRYAAPPGQGPDSRKARGIRQPSFYRHSAPIPPSAACAITLSRHWGAACAKAR